MQLLGSGSDLPNPRRRREQQPAVGSVAGVATVELELAHVGPRSLSTRRRVAVRRADEALARIRLGRGLWRTRGECVANDDKYLYQVDRGWPLVRARWPFGRARVTLRRASDGAGVGEAVQPRGWIRRMALRGGTEFTHNGVTYDLRPLKGRHGGAQVHADGEPAGSFFPRLGATRCQATVPAALDERARLLLLVAAVALGVTRSPDVPTPGGGVPGGGSQATSGGSRHVNLGGLDGRGPGG